MFVTTGLCRRAIDDHIKTVQADEGKKMPLLAIAARPAERRQTKPRQQMTRSIDFVIENGYRMDISSVISRVP